MLTDLGKWLLLGVAVGRPKREKDEGNHHNDEVRARRSPACAGRGGCRRWHVRQLTITLRRRTIQRSPNVISTALSVLFSCSRLLISTATYIDGRGLLILLPRPPLACTLLARFPVPTWPAPLPVCSQPTTSRADPRSPLRLQPFWLEIAFSARWARRGRRRSCAG